MLKLYGAEQSRAAIVHWYLEELGLPYERVLVDLQTGEAQQPEYLAINPLGKVPSIVDGDLKLWESGAILLYLADKYGGAASPEQRAIQSQWVLYANATMGPDIFSETTREKQMPRHLTMVNHLLSQQPFVTGEEFTVADVALGSMLSYIPLMLRVDFGSYAAVGAYMKRLGDRPAFHKAITAVFT